MKFLFWNINKKDLTECLIEINKLKDLDIVGICEGENLDNSSLEKILKMKRVVLLEEYNNRNLILFCKENIKIKVGNENNPYFKEFYLQIQEEEYRIILLHLPSKMNLSDRDQLYFNIRLREKVFSSENSYSKVILFGDFNMNPFEEGMVSSEGWHAIFYDEQVKKIKRIVYEDERYFLYNPTWYLYVSNPQKISGSYYYSKSSTVSYYWYMFDQVLISPDLIDKFDMDKFEILVSTEKRELCKNGKPYKNEYSDHLPIYFEINF